MSQESPILLGTLPGHNPQRRLPAYGIDTEIPPISAEIDLETQRTDSLEKLRALLLTVPSFIREKAPWIPKNGSIIEMADSERIDEVAHGQIQLGSDVVQTDDKKTHNYLEADLLTKMQHPVIRGRIATPFGSRDVFSVDFINSFSPGLGCITAYYNGLPVKQVQLTKRDTTNEKMDAIMALLEAEKQNKPKPEIRLFPPRLALDTYSTADIFYTPASRANSPAVYRSRPKEATTELFCYPTAEDLKSHFLEHEESTRAHYVDGFNFLGATDKRWDIFTVSYVPETADRNELQVSLETRFTYNESLGWVKDREYFVAESHHSYKKEQQDKQYLGEYLRRGQETIVAIQNPDETIAYTYRMQDRENNRYVHYTALLDSNLVDFHNTEVMTMLPQRIREMAESNDPTVLLFIDFPSQNKNTLPVIYKGKQCTGELNPTFSDSIGADGKRRIGFLENCIVATIDETSVICVEWESSIRTPQGVFADNVLTGHLVQTTPADLANRDLTFFTPDESIA
jgi:hypothetical protein